MKIKVTEIEATSEELRATRSLGESFAYALQRAFEPCAAEDNEEDEDEK